MDKNLFEALENLWEGSESFGQKTYTFTSMGITYHGCRAIPPAGYMERTFKALSAFVMSKAEACL